MQTFFRGNEHTAGQSEQNRASHSSYSVCVCECLCTLEGVEGIFRRIDYHADKKKRVRESTQMHTLNTLSTQCPEDDFGRRNFVDAPATFLLYNFL